MIRCACFCCFINVLLYYLRDVSALINSSSVEQIDKLFVIVLITNGKRLIYVGQDSINQIWVEYRKANPNAPKEYIAWAFGNSKEIADELAKLVLEGKKTATASNYTLYELENEELPFPGLINIILDGDGKAVAIAETTSVEVVPFDEVTEEHAYLEGEGDGSLSYWREVHEAIFKKEFENVNRVFDYKIPVVCERFKLLYKK